MLCASRSPLNQRRHSDGLFCCGCASTTRPRVLRALAVENRMDDHELTWYMHELMMYGLGVSRDFEQLQTALADPATRQTRIFWFHLTGFLSHAAMISKYLSPINPRGVKQARMSALRSKLGVDDSSDILPRNARDNIEHFDERIDNWVGQEGQTILEIVLDDRSGYHHLSADQKRIKRVLLEKEMIFISENRNGSKLEIELHSLAAEALRISDEAEKWVANESL